jgi:hypothetical protein
MVQGEMTHLESGIERALATGQRVALPVRGEFRTPDAHSAHIQTTGGLQLEVGAASRVSLSEMKLGTRQRQVELLHGQIVCRVPKLDPGHGFAVVTPNAQVVVHGTEFSVQVETPEEGVTRTCVRVREGVVSVHHSDGADRLLAGEHWGCEPAKESVTAAEHASPGAKGRALARKTTRTTETPRGSLAEETRLLQAALSAERTGDPAGARAHLRALIQRFPDSPLAPEAHQALQRLSTAP